LVKGLQANRNVLLGRVVNLYTDHKNITFLHSSNPQRLRWRLTIAEYNPKLHWVEGESNILADFLSRYPITDEPDELEPYDIFAIEDDDELFDECPVSYKLIHKYQQKDHTLQQLLAQGLYSLTSFHRYKLITSKTPHGSRIVVPAGLQIILVKWYNEFLAHPGVTRLEVTIRQQFTFKGLTTKVLEQVQTRERCQQVKLPRRQYGKIPPKNNVSQDDPWDTVAVDLIGPYKVESRGKEHSLLCLTMIDVASRWIEIAAIDNKTSETVALCFDRTWLSCYPRPLTVLHDNGTKFVGTEFQEKLSSYGIHDYATTIKNPTAYSILERAHQVITNSFRIMEIEDMVLDETYPFADINAKTAFALRATVHTTLQASPAQLCFGRDMIMHTQFVANWNLIRNRHSSEHCKTF